MAAGGDKRGALGLFHLVSGKPIMRKYSTTPSLEARLARMHEILRTVRDELGGGAKRRRGGEAH